MNGQELLFAYGQHWYWLPVALVLMLAGFFWLSRWRDKTARSLGEERLVGPLARVSPARRAARRVLQVCGLMLLGVGLLKPQYGMEQEALTGKGIDLAVALDISNSMLTPDVAPDRLTGSRMEIGELLDRMEGGRVALIPFAGMAYIQTPLTSDFEAVRLFLRDLSPSDVPVPGTAVGRALNVALAALTGQEKTDAGNPAGRGQDTIEIKPFSGSRYKAVLLITDGEDHGSQPLEAARKAAEQGIRIYTVGVGSAVGDLVPGVDDSGKETGDKLTDPDSGDLVVSRLNQELLKDLADTTGGKYFPYTGQPIAREVYHEIEQLEKQEYASRVEELRQNRFQFVLLPAFLLLLAELFLSERARKRRMPAAAAAGLLLAVLPAGLSSCDPFTTSNSTVETGNSRYESQEFDKAKTAYEQAREEIPESSELHFDLGTTELALKNYTEAETAFSRALEGASPALRPKVLANLGLARLQRGLATTDDAGRKEALTQALAALEKAVELDPTNTEARKNLELTLLHLYPPCKKREEALEPNDTADKAAKVADAAGKDLIVCPGNTDFFAVEAEPGDRISVTVKARGEAPAGAPWTEVQDPAGKTVASDPPAPDPGSKAVGQPASERKVFLTAKDKGTYRIRAFERDQEEHPYSLSVEVLPDCKRLQDPFEVNDQQAQAREIEAVRPEQAQVQAQQGQARQGPGPAAIRICPADNDWLWVALKEHESLLVQVAYKPVAGALQFDIVDEAGTVVAQGHDASAGASGSAGEGGGDEQKALFGSVLDVQADVKLFLHVYGDTPEAEAAAQVVAMVRPPCPEGDDEMEENDTRDAAADLTPPAAGGPGAPVAGAPGAPGAAGAPGAGGPLVAPPSKIEKLLRRCPGDDDYFKLSLKKGEQQQVQIAFEHAKGDLKLQVYKGDDAAPAVESDKSGPDQQGEGVMLSASEDTTFTLRVTGADDVTNFYQLTVQPPKPGDGNKDQDKKDQDKKDQDKKEEQKQQKPIEQMMKELDQQKQPNIEAQKALQNAPHLQSPGGKIW